jgi:hypothetical protein
VRYRKIFFLTISVLLLGVAAAAQKPAAAKPAPERVEIPSAAASAAYAELLLRKTELQSELESMVQEYTEDYPKVKELRFILALFDRDIARLAKVKAVDAGKLTVALGKLMVRRIELETDLWNLQRNYKDEHPEVKRAKRRAEIYESAIIEIIN